MTTTTKEQAQEFFKKLLEDKGYKYATENHGVLFYIFCAIENSKTEVRTYKNSDIDWEQMHEQTPTE